MSGAPYPILKWRDMAEKEAAFRALYALGYRRLICNHTVDEVWAGLLNTESPHHHSPRAVAMYAAFQDGHHRIFFASGLEKTYPPTAPVNSASHMVSYLNRHGLVPKSPAPPPEMLADIFDAAALNA